MLRWFALLVAFSVTDAWLTVAEAAHVGVPAPAIEANPVMAYALRYGLEGALLAKLVPLALLGVLLLYRPMPRIVRALVSVYALLGVYHLALVGGWFT